MTDVWHPIETVPKNGTYVLLYSPMHGRVIGMHTGWNVWYLMGFGIVSDEDNQPTHWQHLPPVPQAGRKDDVWQCGYSGAAPVNVVSGARHLANYWSFDIPTQCEICQLPFKAGDEAVITCVNDVVTARHVRCQDEHTTMRKDNV